MRMDGVARCRPEHDVKLLAHGPLSLFSFRFQPAASTSLVPEHVIDVYIRKNLSPVAVLSGGTNMFQEAFLCNDEGTDGVSSTCDDLLAGMLPLRVSVVPAKPSAWGNPVT